MDAYDSAEAALDDIARYDAVIVRVAELDREVIERAEKLKVIAKHGSGLDNVDIAAASENDILVCNTPGVNSRSVAEHAIALQFGVRRNLGAADRHVRDGGWERSEFVGYELQGSTLGLMGFGSIAHETAAIAQGIGLNVLIYDPGHPDDQIPEGIGRVDELIELFEESDAVSLHVPLVDGTYHAVSTDQFEALGEDGILINTSRGGVVDKDALLEALNNDVIAGAGIDNFEEEPPGANHPIYEHDEVLMTPHIAGVTYDALERMSRSASDNVRTVYESGLPESTVNREALGREPQE
jgi:D-3-phosphoglycerate dehydrogenase